MGGREPAASDVGEREIRREENDRLARRRLGVGACERAELLFAAMLSRSLLIGRCCLHRLLLLPL